MAVTGVFHGRQVEDGNGSAVSGAKVVFKKAGTSTNATTYTDAALTTPAANPVVADAAGYFETYLDPVVAYDVALKSPDEATTYSSYFLQSADGSNESTVADINALQAATWASAEAPARVNVNANHATGDGGGAFYYDSADTTSTDDDAMTVVTASGRRYKRLWGKHGVFADWFGDCSTAVGALAAITAAMAFWSPFAATTTDGGLVWLQSKIYTVSDSIDVSGKHGIRLQGAGPRATELKADGDFSVIEGVDTSSAPLNGFRVAGMLIRGGGKANTSAHGISLTWSNNCGVDDCIFYGCRHGLDLHHQFITKVTGCYAHGDGTDQNYIGFYQGRTTLTNIDNAVLFTDCVTQACEQAGQRIENGQGSTYTSCQFFTSPYGSHVGAPASGTVKVGWMHWINCLWDSCTTENFYAVRGNATECSQWMIGSGWTGNSSGHGMLIENCRNYSVELALAYYNIKTALRTDGVLRAAHKIHKAEDWNRESSGANNHPCFEIEDTTYSTFDIANGYTQFGSPVSFKEVGASDHNLLRGDAEMGLAILGSNTLPLLPHIMAKIAGITMSAGAMYRNVNNGGLILAGGNSSSTGANLEIYGGSVGSGLDNNILADADIIRFRSQAGSEFGRATASAGSLNINTEYQVGGTKVIGAQGAAVSDASGGSTVDTEARTAINAALARLRAHGLIAT